jgi:hypothetical protein
MVSFNTYRCDSAFEDIYVARVNMQGVVLDSNGFAVCTTHQDQHKAKLAYGDGIFLVTWEDERNFSQTGYDIYGTRVKPGGTVLDLDGKCLTLSDLWEKSPDVCWMGNDFTIIWEQGDYGINWDIFGARVDTAGEILDSIPIGISTACDAQTFGCSDWSGGSYLSVWEENGDLLGIRLSCLGDVLDSATITICSAAQDQNHPDLVWGDGNFFAVWEDFRNQKFDIYGTRIDSGGTVLDALGLPIYVDANTDQRRPAIASDGENYLVLWQHMLDSTEANYRIEALRISPEGLPIDQEPLLLSEGDKGSYPDVAFSGSKYLAVWLDANFWDIHGALVESDGTVGPTIGVRIAGGLQEHPSVASDGSDFLVVWQDCGNHWPYADIVATRVSSAGEIMDPGGIIISMDANAADQLPAVTFDGVNYVVTWRRITGASGGLYASRVTPQGVVLDAGGIFITEISPYSGVSICLGPTGGKPIQSPGQCLMLFSKYQDHPFNSLRMFGSFFWGQSGPNSPPQAFSLLLPADQDTVGVPVLLDWEDALDPDPFDYVTYTAYVSSSPLFVPESTTIVDDLDSSECYFLPEVEGSILWWRVKAGDRWGESSWSGQTWCFHLGKYGDVNGDGKVDSGDVVYLLNYLFRQGPAPQPLASGDVNGDCEVTAGDVIYMINYLFSGGPSPQVGCA